MNVRRMNANIKNIISILHILNATVLSNYRVKGLSLIAYNSAEFHNSELL